MYREPDLNLVRANIPKILFAHAVRVAAGVFVGTTE
jgi:hypothetical protein